MKPPKFEIEDVEDAYAWYVSILGAVDCDTFWFADCAFVDAVAADKSAYEGWVAREREYIGKGKKHGHKH